MVNLLCIDVSTVFACSTDELAICRLRCDGCRQDGNECELRTRLSTRKSLSYWEGRLTEDEASVARLILLLANDCRPVILVTKAKHLATEYGIYNSLGPRSSQENRAPS